MTDWKQYVDSMVRKVAEQTILKYTHNIFDNCYLHYGTGILQTIHDSEFTPLKLAFPEHLPRNLTATQLTQFIVNRIGRVPFLPNAI